MTAPTFVEIDDDAFSNTRKSSLSVWHLKRIAENYLWTVNNRLTNYACSWSTWDDGAALALPTISTVRWACFGPFPVPVPPVVRPTETTSVPEITVRLFCTADDFPARVYAFSDAFTAPTPAQLDAATNSGATGAGAYVAVGSSTESLTVKVEPGKLQNIWIAVRNERDVNKATIRTTSNLNQTFGTVRRGLLPEIVVRPFGFSGITSNTAPRQWYAMELGTDDAVEFAYDQCYTIAYADDDADGDGTVRRLMLAEMLANTTTRGATSDDREHEFNGFPVSFSNNFSNVWGDLGALRVSALLIDQTQEFQVEDRRYWPQFRWRQGVSASRVRTLLKSLRDLRQHCMPMIGMGLMQRDPDTDADYPGVWDTDGGWSGYSVSYVAPYQTTRTVAEWPYRTGQDFRPGDTAYVYCHVPYYAAVDREDVDIDTPISLTATLAVYGASGGAVSGVTETVDLEIDDLTQWREIGVPVTHAWIRATQQARSFKLYADATASGTYGSIFGMDGVTALGDIGMWKVLTIPLDVSSLTANTNYAVRLSVTQDSATDGPVTVAFSHPVCRIATGAP